MFIDGIIISFPDSEPTDKKNPVPPQCLLIQVINTIDSLWQQSTESLAAVQTYLTEGNIQAVTSEVQEVRHGLDKILHNVKAKQT